MNLATQLAQTVSDQGLTAEAFAATVLYAFMGIIIMGVSVVAFNWLFKLNVHKELVQENNTAFGILVGCFAIAIAIIIAGTIVS